MPNYIIDLVFNLRLTQRKFYIMTYLMAYKT